MRQFKIFDVLGKETLQRIDKIIKLEVVPYVKAFQDLPLKTQGFAQEVAFRESPQSYARNLKDAWYQHNELAEVIDYYLAMFYEGKVDFNDAKFIKIIRSLVQRAYETEQYKRIYSAGVKSLFENKIPSLIQHYSLNQSEQTLILTSSKSDFWSYRLGEHVKYFLAGKEKPAHLESIREQLVQTFHAGKEEVLDGRLQSILGSFSQLSEKELRNFVNKYNEYETGLKNSAIASFYLTSGRPNLQAIQDLIVYDNREEYLFAYNFLGVPDLFLRKEVIHFLVQLGLINNRPSILLYEETEIDQALEKWENTLMLKNKEKEMIKIQPPLFLQTRPSTCGVASLMMILGAFRNEVLTSRLEGRIRKDLKMKGYDFVPAISLAEYLKRLDFNIEVFHYGANLFWSHLRNFLPDMLEIQEARYLRAKNVGISIDKKHEITPYLLKFKLNEGALVICGIEISEEVKHAVLLYEIKDGQAYFNDPAMGSSMVPIDDFIKMMSTNLGTWCIIVKDSK